MANRNVRYIEDANGFIAFGKKYLAKCTDINISFSRATDETTSLESNHVAEFQATKFSWQGDCTAICANTGVTYSTLTGGTAAGTLTGATNGQNLMELFKTQLNPLLLTVKVADSHIERGSVILTGLDLKASTDKFISFSVKFQGTGSLTKSTT